jgi:hypothetical protein
MKALLLSLTLFIATPSNCFTDQDHTQDQLRQVALRQAEALALQVTEDSNIAYVPDEALGTLYNALVRVQDPFIRALTKKHLLKAQGEDPNYQKPLPN